MPRGSIRQFFSLEPSTVGCDLSADCPKKMSGRWGDRPLGRGGWRVLQPEASPFLPHVLLRSRAADRDTGAIRPKPFCSGSRNQLPITVTILLLATFLVDSPTGSFFSVLPAVFPTPVLVPPYFGNLFALPLELSPLPIREAMLSTV